MDKTTFAVVYWIVAVAIIIGVYFLFAKLRDFVINYGKKTTRKYMDKIDPNLDEVDELSELDGIEPKEKE